MIKEEYYKDYYLHHGLRLNESCKNKDIDGASHQIAVYLESDKSKRLFHECVEISGLLIVLKFNGDYQLMNMELEKTGILLVKARIDLNLFEEGKEYATLFEGQNISKELQLYEYIPDRQIVEHIKSKLLN